MRRLILAIWCAASICQAGTYYVSPGGTGDGADANHPKAAGDLSWIIEGDVIYWLSMDETVSSLEWPTTATYYAKYLDRFGDHQWTFESVTGGDYCQVGQFANLDQWVVGTGGVKITAIAPAWNEATGLHGSMRNPTAGKTIYTQGLRRVDTIGDESYDDTLNVAKTLPLSLTGTDSLISSYGSATAIQLSYVKSNAILTVLSAAPASGSFRPGYCGDTSKTVEWNISDVNWAALASLTIQGTPPTLSGGEDGDDQDASLERCFQRPWLYFQSKDARGCRIAGSYGQEDYGREANPQVCQAAIYLNTSHATQEQKETLMYRFLQYGIDAYSVVRYEGGTGWNDGAGHSQGKKLPILFAGKILGDAGMTAIGAKSGDYIYDSGSYDGTIQRNPGGHNPIYTGPADMRWFAEDTQTYYVSENDVYTPPYSTVLYGVTNQYKGTVTVAEDLVTVTRQDSPTESFLTVSSSDERYISFDGDSRAMDPRAHAYDVASVVDAQTLILAEPYEDTPGSGKTYSYGNGSGYGHAFYNKMKDYCGYYDYYEHTIYMIGLPEVGVEYFNNPRQDGPEFGTQNNLPGWKTHETYIYSGIDTYPQTALAVLICGLRTAWNHDVFFALSDRLVEYHEAMVAQGIGGFTTDHIISTWLWDMWEEYRDDYEPAVWSIKTSSPSPANGATGQSTALTLSWADVNGVDKWDIYLDTNSPPEVEIGTVNGDVNEYAISGLTNNTRYYWRVDSNTPDDHGLGSIWGTVWYFDAGTTVPPEAPINPSPFNGATNQALSLTISWENGGGDGTYDVDFGTDPNAMSQIVTDGSYLSFSLSGLSYSTTYYWQVTKADVETSQVWSFTTMDEPVPESKTVIFIKD